MFIQQLSKESFKLCSQNAKSLEYKQLAESVQSNERLEFLHQILPKKKTVREFRKIIANLPDPDKSTSESSGEEGEEEESEEESSVDSKAKEKDSDVEIVNE